MAIVFKDISNGDHSLTHNSSQNDKKGYLHFGVRPTLNTLIVKFARSAKCLQFSCLNMVLLSQHGTYSVGFDKIRYQTQHVSIEWNRKARVDSKLLLHEIRQRIRIFNARVLKSVFHDYKTIMKSTTPEKIWNNAIVSETKAILCHSWSLAGIWKSYSNRSRKVSGKDFGTWDLPFELRLGCRIQQLYCNIPLQNTWKKCH